MMEIKKKKQGKKIYDMKVSVSAIFHHKRHNSIAIHAHTHCYSLSVTKAEELNKQTNHVTTY